jgi:hypothetical protein
MALTRLTHLETAETRGVDALEEALNTVPFYRAWRACDPGPARPLDERLRALPVL